MTFLILLIPCALSLTRRTFKLGILSSAIAFFNFIPFYPIEAVPVGTSIQPGRRSTISNWVIGGIAAMTFLLMNCVNLASAQGERFPYNHHPQNFKHVNSGYKQP